MTDINLGASIRCNDGPCGEVTNVVLNPVTRKISHIVVEDKKLPRNPTRLVPIGKVANSTQTQITLRCSIHDVALMPPFETTRYIKQSGSGEAYAQGGYSPFARYDIYDEYSYVANDTGYTGVDVGNIPTGELALANGMKIQASDGKVGKLDELALNSKSGEVTHLLMRKGRLWGKKEVSIPVSAAKVVDGETIYLKLDKKAVGELPTVPLRQ